MNLKRVAVLGGGPGGLYAARLLKLSNPSADVAVYEQNPPHQTFGFGVGLASKTQRNLRDADAVSFEAIVAASHSHELEMQVGGKSARLSNQDGISIARTTLLDVLQRQAEDAGVRICAGVRADVDDLDADLIVAADGINSATRARLADDFEPRIDTGAGLYLWCGTDFELPTALFTPVTTEHGTFVAHAYPYADDRSTFLIETDEDTWRRAGFDFSTDETLAQDSDGKSLEYLQEAFAETLQGHRLIGNRTRWMRFRTISCGSWHSKNVALLGDAAHTAHYSIGSGTKLAMEDAIALARAVQSSTTLDDALAIYEEVRRPAVDHLQEIASRSELWWESFPQRMHLPVEQLMIAFMTRAGKVSVSRFLESAPLLVRHGLASYANVSADSVPESNIDDWILAQPLARGGTVFDDRIASTKLRNAATTADLLVDFGSAWGPEAELLIEKAAGAQTLILTGPSDRCSVLTRLDLAERLVHLNDAVVVVDAPISCRSNIAAGLASSRLHLAYFPERVSPKLRPELSRIAGSV